MIQKASATKVHVTIRDVTGTNVAEMDLDPGLRVGSVAESVAAGMSLPNDTIYALRDESTAAFLDDDDPIGEVVDPQAGPDVALVLTPRAHLG